jgi:hypothetical protein
MANVVINHCTLRVRRRNGWSWGSEPRELLDAAMRSLPELLAQHFASLWPDDADVEISTPLKIRIPIGLGELGVLPRQVLDYSTHETSSHYAGLGRRIEAAINSTLTQVQVLPAETIISKTGNGSEPDTVNISAATPPWAGSPLLVLLKWQAQGVLETRLASFSHAAVEAWHRHLFQVTAPAQSPAASTSGNEVEFLIRELAPIIPHAILDRAGILRRRLIMAVRAAARLNTSAIEETVRLTIDNLLPLMTPGVPIVADTKSIGSNLITSNEIPDQAPAKLDLVPSPPSFEIKAVSLPAEVIESDLRISSAVPFLLLGPLGRIGYLEVLAATLEAADLTKQSSLFALALAHKVLEPPERGWRRDPASIVAAAAFAGLHSVPAESALVEFAGDVALHLSPLEGLLSACLTEGHRVGQPLFLYQTVKPSGLLLMDVEGSFPVAWSSDLDGLLPVLHGFGTSVCLIPRASADPALLTRLDTEDCLFLTNGPPARDEHWRELRRASTSWWTNDRHSRETTLLSSARLLLGAHDSAEEFWKEFSLQRPSIPLADDGTFDNHLTLAASVALGTIAWTLWREREPTTPQLALTRFRDLDARVRFDSREVSVLLPRGRRYQDLMDHRLLDDIPCVPWLAGRKLQFAGG